MMKNESKGNTYDVAVIGGGPAGMMAAGRAAECGARVVLIEKNTSLGKKLRITGGGRCNITNAELDVRKLVLKYGPKGKALFGAFARFGVADSMQFFEDRNLPLKVEAQMRAFPASDKADDVWQVFIQYLRDGNVEVMSDTSVTGLASHDGMITGVRTTHGIVHAKSYIMATGGKSRPETGSTGEGLDWMHSLGHSVEKSDAALVPIKIKEKWVKSIPGVSFAAAKLTAIQEGKKFESRTGKILFTHFGLSGPLVINMSKSLADAYKYGPVDIEIDLYPTLDIGALDKKVLASLSPYLNKKLRNSLKELVPPMMATTLLELAGIDPEKQVNVLTKTERGLLVRLLKKLPMSLDGFLGVEKAVVTSGGVALDEVDFTTMRSKLYCNLYFTGDILNFDRPTGGYSLQICWTTGYLAGESAAGHH